MVELLSKWRRATVRLTEELGRGPTPEEIARVLGLPRKKLPIIKKAIHIYNADAANRSGRSGLVARRDGDGRAAKAPDDEMVEGTTCLHILRDARNDGDARSDGPADAVRPRRLRAADAQRNRRSNWASPGNACGRSKPKRCRLAAIVARLAMVAEQFASAWRRTLLRDSGHPASVPSPPFRFREYPPHTLPPRSLKHSPTFLSPNFSPLTLFLLRDSSLRRGCRPRRRPAIGAPSLPPSESPTKLRRRGRALPDVFGLGRGRPDDAVFHSRLDL